MYAEMTLLFSRLYVLFIYFIARAYVCVLIEIIIVVLFTFNRNVNICMWQVGYQKLGTKLW